MSFHTMIKYLHFNNSSLLADFVSENIITVDDMDSVEVCTVIYFKYLSFILILTV